MLKFFAVGIAKVVFVLAIAAVGVKTVTALSSANVKPPKATCPCECPYYYMCTGPPSCICIEPQEEPSRPAVDPRGE